MFCGCSWFVLDLFSLWCTCRSIGLFNSRFPSLLPFPHLLSIDFINLNLSRFPLFGVAWDSPLFLYILGLHASVPFTPPLKSGTSTTGDGSFAWGPHRFSMLGTSWVAASTVLLRLWILAFYYWNHIITCCSMKRVYSGTSWTAASTPFYATSKFWTSTTGDGLSPYL